MRFAMPPETSPLAVRLAAIDAYSSTCIRQQRVLLLALQTLCVVAFLCVLLGPTPAWLVAGLVLFVLACLCGAAIGMLGRLVHAALTSGLELIDAELAGRG